jgi:hypothetical protein
MPTEPTHRVHQLLKGYARHRRELAGSAAGIDLGTRARLQAEVARTFGPNPSAHAARSYALGVPSLWPRLLWGCACVAVLVGIATVFLRNDGERQRRLADVDNLQFFPTGAGRLSVPGGPPAVAENVRSFQLGSAPASGPAAGPTATESHQREQVVVRQAQTPSPEFSKPNLALAVPRPRGEMEEFASNAPRFALGLTPPPEPMTAAAETKALQDAVKPAPQLPAVATAALANSSQNNLLFQQDRSKYRPNRNSPPLPQVLSRFEVQPDGANLRIVDADGSVYAGAAAPGVNEAQPFSFHAVGTNRSLNQLVVFTGEFEPSANLASADPGAANLAQNVNLLPGSASARAKAAQPAAATQQPQIPGLSAANSLIQQGRIQGQAVIGGKNQLNIDAQQVAP